MANENMPWHNQVKEEEKEEEYVDNEMAAHLFWFGSSLLTRYPIINNIKPSKISPCLTRGSLYSVISKIV